MQSNNFTFRCDAGLAKMCLSALRKAGCIAKMPETKATLITKFESLIDEIGPATRSLVLGGGEPMVLRRALSALGPQEEAPGLLLALHDYETTESAAFQRHLDERRRRRQERPGDSEPAPEQLEEHRWKMKRDAIFREMMGTPQRVDIWGNVVEETVVDVESGMPGDPVAVTVARANRAEAMNENFKRAYGGEPTKNLREHAKTHHFPMPGLQTLRFEFKNKARGGRFRVGPMTGIDGTVCVNGRQVRDGDKVCADDIEVLRSRGIL